MAMTDDRVAGTTKKIGDQVEEGFRRATGDLKMQVEDRARQAEGSLEDLLWAGEGNHGRRDPRKRERSRRPPPNDYRGAPLHDRRDRSRDRILDRPVRPRWQLLEPN